MNTFGQAVIIGAMSVAAAVGQWKYAPEPAKPAPVACDPALMPPDEICLATVQETWAKDGVLLWIDARSEGEWKADGLPGSIHLTTVGGENFDDLLEKAMPRLMESKRAVVYCGSTSCGISKEVVSRLKQYDMVPGVISEVKALHGGHEALKSAGLLHPTNPNSKP
ncbi:MAG: rhodanese-like protein [Akkermansiaceae bacterium]|nr:rhodanese-like protein [Akkermansiaceae bacterium]